MVLLPIGFNLSGKYIGHGEVVFWSNYFWWFDYAVTQLFVNPLHDSYLFYPLGLDMVDSIFPFILFIPVTHIFGSVVSYNIYVLFTFIFAGYGMFLLCNHLFRDSYIAFISGLIFAFFPFHFGAALGHIHSLSIMWIPFFVLFFLKMYEEPTFSNAVMSGLFFAINALTSWTIAVMLTIFIFIFLLVKFKRIFERNFFVCFTLFTVFSLIMMSPGLYVISKNYFFNPDMVKSLGENIYYSADPLAFVTPSPIHPLLSPFSEDIYAQFTGNISENIMFIGYSVIVLSFIGFISNRKNAIFRLFGISLAVFFILSLGPCLHFNGIWRFTEENLTIILPGIITYYLPFYNMIRVPSRYDIMIMFCFAIIAGLGLQTLIAKYQIISRKKFIFSAFISLIILCEFAAIMPSQKVQPIPEFYFNASHDGNFLILEIPFCRIGSPNSNETMRRYYEYQKVHQKKMFGGYWSRITPTYDQIIHSDPILSQLILGYHEIINSSIENPLLYLNKEYGVKYVVIHTDLVENETLHELRQYLGDSYYSDNSVSSDPLIVYRIFTSEEHEYTNTEKEIHLQFTGGWHYLEHWNGSSTRWISNDANISVYTNKNESANLSFKTQSFSEPRTLMVYADETLFLQQKILPSMTEVSVQIPLKTGKNNIRLYVPEGCESPSDIPELQNEDTRCLSIAIQNFTIS